MLSATLIQTLTGSLTLQKTLQRLLKSLVSSSAFPAQGVFANVYHPETHCVEFLAHATLTQAQKSERIVKLPADIVLERLHPTKTIFTVADTREDPFTHYVIRQTYPNAKSYLMMRLQVEQQHMGILCFYSEAYNEFNATHVACVEPLYALLALNVGFALTLRLQAQNRRLAQTNASLKAQLAHMQAPDRLASICSHTPSLHRLRSTLEQIASFDLPVLITGESGTGKEVVASMLHQLSKRSERPFVRVNCGAISESLIESELFGHEAGAFTGATQRHVGLFEASQGGMIFLDEIGELPLSLQAKLLHVLQHHTVRRIGGTEEIPLDVQVIAATNRDLEKQVLEKSFRLDLLYRINALPIEVAPLRERIEDIEPLIRYFIHEFCVRYDVPAVELTQEAITQAYQYAWPGNVRELKNVVFRALMTRPTQLTQLPIQTQLAQHAPRAMGNPLSLSQGATFPSFEDLQKTYFIQLLQQTQGRIAGPFGAAQRAKMHPNTLRSRLQKLGIDLQKAVHVRD